MDLALFLAGLAFTFAVAVGQARQMVTRGTDHPVHLFLATAIRESGHRLLTKIPRILNDAYCSAYPLFLHWLLSFLRPKQIRRVAILLNPLANAALVILAYLALRFQEQQPALAANAGYVALLVALAPQFFHIRSARTQGISSRPVGLLLFQLLAWFTVVGPGGPFGMVAAVAVGYLIWGFNTFAQQGMVLLGAALGVGFGEWGMLAAAGSSLFAFVALHPRYSLSYLLHTVRFIRAYATELAEVFVLKDRYSIWRDVVYDVWVRVARSPFDGMSYAYNNGLMMVLALNPLVPLAAYLTVTGRLDGPVAQSAGRVAVAGMLVFVLTSFRRTRFLGEPERYVELATVFGTAAAAWYGMTRLGGGWAAALAGYFLVADVAQLAFSAAVHRRRVDLVTDLRDVEETIGREWRGEPVRFTSNNEQLTKLLMANPWSFVRLWSADEGYGGIPIRQAVLEFPYITREAVQAAVRRYRLNACLLDKSVLSNLADGDADLERRAMVRLETDRYRLYRIAW